MFVLVFPSRAVSALGLVLSGRQRYRITFTLAAFWLRRAFTVHVIAFRHVPIGRTRPAGLNAFFPFAVERLFSSTMSAGTPKRTIRSSFAVGDNWQPLRRGAWCPPF
jgi:hypothetical protein